MEKSVHLTGAEYVARTAAAVDAWQASIRAIGAPQPAPNLRFQEQAPPPPAALRTGRDSAVAEQTRTRLTGAEHVARTVAAVNAWQASIRTAGAIPPSPAEPDSGIKSPELALNPAIPARTPELVGVST